MTDVASNEYLHGFDAGRNECQGRQGAYAYVRSMMDRVEFEAFKAGFRAGRASLAPREKAEADRRDGVKRAA